MQADDSKQRRRLLIRTADACGLLDVSSWTLKRWIKRGRLEGFSLDGRGVSHVSAKSLRRLVNSTAEPGVEPVQLTAI